MTTVTDSLLTDYAGVVDLWRQKVEHASAGERPERPDISGRMHSWVEALSKSDAQAGNVARDAHVAMRLRQGFELAEILEELAALAQVVSARWTPLPQERWPSPIEIERFYTELLTASARAGELFTEHVRVSEQRGKRLARRLDVAASRRGIATVQDSDAILEIFLDATHASAALLVVRDGDSQRVESFASRDGFTNGSFQTHGLTLDLGATVGRGASDIDSFVSTAEGSLCADGVGSILVTRLPADESRRMAIVLCRPLGQPSFEINHVRLAESLGERLSWLRCRARLETEFNRATAILRSEQLFRDRFVAILAHDLRGPLMIARVGADLLAARPLSVAQTREVITRIDGALDRADRMLRDLLDANLLRAGGKLTIVPVLCDLGALAETIAEELRSIHGARFTVQAEHVEGFWSSDEVHRAVWNLAVNAVKYGDGQTSIAIDVRVVGDCVRLRVHNFGPPIPTTELRHLFEPFNRAVEPASRSSGWGLGLAIVKGCAEAHGGSVTVSSDAHDGTTFSIELPLDARPFAQA